MENLEDELSVRQTVPMSADARLQLRTEALHRGIGHGALARVLIACALDRLEGDPALGDAVSTGVAAEKRRYRRITTTRNVR